MSELFGYPSTKDWAIWILGDELPVELREKSEFILNLHLRCDTLAMPTMSFEEHENIKAKIIDGSTLEEVAEEVCLHLEDTSTKKGMLRVMARTHLNGLGMDQVSRGNLDKTLSPRILDFVDTIEPEQEVREYQRELLACWLRFATNEGSTDDPSLHYDKDACDSLKTLVDAYKKDDTLDLLEFSSAKALYSYLHGDENVDDRLSWYQIVLGIITGLNYLNKNNWDLYDKATSSELDYNEIHGLIANTQKEIVGYSYSLAGSFLADLGGPWFVKIDSHVNDFITASSGNLSSPEKYVKAVIESATACNTKPRFLDIVMNIVGCGKLPLLGVELKPPLHIEALYFGMMEYVDDVD
jgi:hypothetical protein